MDIRELRVGNHFIYHHLEWDFTTKPHTKKLVKSTNEVVESIHENGVNIERYHWGEVSNIFHYEQMEGIPLTEEWLEKLGFNWDVYYQGTIKELFKLVLKESSGGGYYLEVFRTPYKIAENIKYVHTLQNIFFALTGSELELKQLV
jgi:hypothetical protein